MLLQYQISYDIISSVAGVAQLVEQLIRNQQVMGSSPITSSRKGSVSSLFCRCSSMAELQLPKLTTRVRFPSSAPYRVRCGFGRIGLFCFPHGLAGRCTHRRADCPAVKIRCSVRGEYRTPATAISEASASSHSHRYRPMLRRDGRKTPSERRHTGRIPWEMTASASPFPYHRGLLCRSVP